MRCYHSGHKYSRHPLNSGYLFRIRSKHIPFTPIHCCCLGQPNTSNLVEAEPLQAVLTVGRCRSAGSSGQAGPVLQTSPNGCEELVQQGSQLKRLPEVQLTPWLEDLVCTLVHSTGEGDNKIGQDRGFPKQNPAAGWVEVLGTFYLISPRSQALSKW